MSNQPNFDAMIPDNKPQGETIREIESLVANGETGFSIEELSPKRFIDNEAPQVEWIIDNVLAKGLCGFIYGEGGSYKSLAVLWLILQRACADIHSTQKWLDMFPVTFGRSIFFSAEDTEIDLHLRIKSILSEIKKQRIDISENAFNDQIGENCLICTQEKWDTVGKPYIVDESGTETDKVDYIVKTTNEFKADLIVLETFSRIANVDEIDNRLGARVVSTMESIRNKTGATVLCIAHSSKASRQGQNDTHGQNGLRGAGALMDNARFGIWFQAKKSDNGVPQVEIVNSKTFRCKRFDKFTLNVAYPNFTVSETTSIETDVFEKVVQFVKDNPGCTQ